MTASQSSPTDPGEQVLPALPRDSEGPVFSEPWQAQAFAMAVRLHEQGHFTWTEWATELSRHIGDAGPTDTTEYYEHWLVTLESIATSSSLTTVDELTDRKQAWQRAAEATPHGQPIELGAELAG
jgi:nitrile hydratase accessory protein